MNSTSHGGRIVSMRRAAVSLALGVAVVITSSTGCAQVSQVVPQAVVWAPGSYTFGIPPGSPSNQGPAGTIGLCSDTQTYLYVQLSLVGYIRLDSWTAFDGSPSDVGLVGDTGDVWNPDQGASPTTGPVPPGCGTFHYYITSEWAPWTDPTSTTTVWFTKTPPAP